MKIICTQENLRTGLQTVSRIINSSNTLPILNNLLLETENGLLKISSTNLEISIHTFIRCKIEEVGKICVPAKLFTDLINSLPNENVILEVFEGGVKVKTEKHNAIIKTLPGEDFPPTPQIESRTKSNIPTKILKNSLEEVIFAASTNETQPEICGVLIKPLINQCVMVATDRYRLAEKKINNVIVGNQPIILPLKSCQEVLRLLNTTTDTVEFFFNDNQIQFNIGDTQLISRIIDGQYPDYEQIIPTEFATVAVVNRLALLNALKTGGIFSQNSNSIQLKITEQEVVVSSGSQDFGQSTITIPGDIKGPTLQVVFNFRYLLDMLNSVSASEIEISLNTDSLPVVFRGYNNQDYLYLVMPIKS